MKRTLWVFPILLLGVLGLAATPLLTLGQLRTALSSADQDTLGQLVDFPRVRSSLKDQSRTRIRQRLHDEDDLPSVNVFRAEIAGLFVDQLLENIVSPPGFALLLRSGKIAPSQIKPSRAPARDSLLLPSQYRLRYSSWRRFDVFLRSDNDQEVQLRMERQGLFAWRIVDLLLPPEAE